MTALNLLKNRNFILILAFALGLAAGEGADFTRSLTLPTLMLIMTLSTVDFSFRDFMLSRKWLRPVLLGITFNYLVLSGVMLLLARWLMPNEELWTGFVIVAAVPPAVAVMPFTHILRGNVPFSVIGTVGVYLVSLAVAPAMTALLLSKAVEPMSLLIVLVKLIIVPLALSRLLSAPAVSAHVRRWRGGVINWLFFIVVYTVIGLNRGVFFSRPGELALISTVAFTCTFLLGGVVGFVLKRLNVSRETRTSLILMGTLKNAGLAGVIALSLFNEKASVPAAVVIAFSTLYFIWLGLRRDRL